MLLEHKEQNYKVAQVSASSVRCLKLKETENFPPEVVTKVYKLCCHLNKSGPHRLIYLSTLTPVCSTAWEELGSMEKVCHCVHTLNF